MIRLFLIGHTYKYECEKLCQIFFPLEKPVFPAEDDEAGEAAATVRITLETADQTRRCRCEAWLKDPARKSEAEEILSARSTDEEGIARVAVKALSALTGIKPPWGVLTGVRPAKLMRKLIETQGEAAAKETFTTDFFVREDKTALAARVAQAEITLLRDDRPRDCSVYVSIPFCPTRCSYCSFVSHSITQAKKLIPDYIRLLTEELAMTAGIADKLGLRVRSVYVGGGTPTSLSPEDLYTVTNALNRCFNARNTPEFTVEAGRPDTVTPEKLQVLKEAGVQRISINPQTFSNEVLQHIGRRHTAEETLEKFALARQMGFDNINMDLIAGLPGDSVDGFCASLTRAIDLAPENITVHTLALKRAAKIVTGGETGTVAAKTADMVDYAGKALTAAGYGPYYMYRQSRSAGNLENVGWTVPGKACLYNVYMMEEIHTVLACGGGAVTKLADPPTNRLVRVFNFKYPYEYISRFHQLVERKDEIVRFYEG